MQEVELKFRVDDFSAIERELKFEGVIQEMDVYYRHPSRDFLKTDEWLRIRTIHYDNWDGEETRITYKGPKTGSARQEIEIELFTDAGHELLQALGFSQMIVVAKHRRQLQNQLKQNGYYIDVCLDEVSRLGKFVELEILVEDKDVEEATQVLRDIAARYGLTKEEKSGYAQMMIGLLVS